MARMPVIAWRFSPDTLVQLDQLTSAEAAIQAAGMGDDVAVRACVAAIAARSCEKPCFEAEFCEGQMVVSLGDDALLALFAQFQSFAEVARERNRARHLGSERR